MIFLGLGLAPAKPFMSLCGACSLALHAPAVLKPSETKSPPLFGPMLYRPQPRSCVAYLLAISAARRAPFWAVELLRQLPFE